MELPSIQHLLSTLEEPLQKPGSVPPTLMLPGRPSSVHRSPTLMPVPAPAPVSMLPPLRAPELGNPTTSTNRNQNRPSSSSSARTDCTCKSQRRNSSHIPRPRNAFILFRQHFHYELFPKNENMLSKLGSFKTNSEISREIGHRWRRLSSKEKQHWRDLALLEKERHKLMYPDYKYIPRKMEMETQQCEQCLKKRRRSEA